MSVNLCLYVGVCVSLLSFMSVFFYRCMYVGMDKCLFSRVFLRGFLCDNV